MRHTENEGLSSQAALAKAAGVVTASNISKAERGLKELSPDQLEAVAKALGVAPDTFLDAGQEPAQEMPAGASESPAIEDQELLALAQRYKAGEVNISIAVIMSGS